MIFATGDIGFTGSDFVLDRLIEKNVSILNIDKFT